MIPPFLSSPPQSSNGSSSQQHKREAVKMMMTTDRYKFLCGRIIVTLLTEIGILVSILVTYSCTFYTSIFFKVNNAHDDQDSTTITTNDSAAFTASGLILNVGLFKFAISQEPLTFFEHSQCIPYGSMDSNDPWAEQTLSMARSAQGWAIAAPVLAVVGIIVMGVDVLGQHCGRLSFGGRNGSCVASLPKCLTSLFLIMAGVCQIVAFLSFDGEHACNRLRDDGGDTYHPRACDASTGTITSVVAATIYIVASLLSTTSRRSHDDHSTNNDNNIKKAPSTRQQQQQQQQSPRERGSAQEVASVNLVASLLTAASPQCCDKNDVGIGANSSNNNNSGPLSTLQRQQFEAVPLGMAADDDTSSRSVPPPPPPVSTPFTITSLLGSIIRQRNMSLKNSDDDDDKGRQEKVDSRIIADERDDDKDRVRRTENTPGDDYDDVSPHIVKMGNREHIVSDDNISDVTDKEPLGVQKVPTFQTKSSTQPSLNPDDEIDDEENCTEHEIVFFQIGELEDEDNTSEYTDEEPFDVQKSHAFKMKCTTQTSINQKICMEPEIFFFQIGALEDDENISKIMINEDDDSFIS